MGFEKIIIAICILTLFFLISLFAFSMVIEHVTLEFEEEKQVPCYDRWGNLINGVSCTERIECGLISRTFGVPFYHEGCGR